MTDERFMEIDKIIQGITKGYGSRRVFSIDPEDLKQHLWFLILKQEDKEKREIEPNLIAHICYMAVNYIARSDCRKPDFYSLDFNWESNEQVSNNTIYENKQGKSTSDIEYSLDNLDQQILIKDLLTKFPVGSKERKYIDFWASYVGLVDRYNPQTDSKYKDGFSENRLAIELGFPGTGSASYKKFRANMRKFIAKFLDLDYKV